MAPAKLGNCRNKKGQDDLLLTDGEDHIREGDIVKGVHGYRVAEADLPEIKATQGKIIFEKNCEISANGIKIPAMRKANPKGEWGSFYVGMHDNRIRSFILISPGKTKSWLKRYDSDEWEGVNL